MTETGMILSNPLHGERRPGLVGLPLPGVQVKSVPVGGQGDAGASTGRQAEGELLVAGDAVFKEYWNRPDATAEAFDASGFFRCLCSCLSALLAREHACMQASVCAGDVKLRHI